jgi:hypothetical protein
MAKAKPGPDSEKTRVNRWFSRITSADKSYDEWADQFKCRRLEEYREGVQWSGVDDKLAARKYCINLVYASVETAKPSLLFYKPQYRIQPKPGRGDDFGSTAEEQARFCQDAIQTQVDDPDLGFQLETKLALDDAFFRFGVVEVGYSADWIDNPNADKPILKDNGTDPLLGDDDQPIKQPSKVLKPGTKESLFVKWIPAKQFRVGLSSKNRLQTNDWVGYWEWAYAEDVKRNKDYQGTSDLKATGIISSKLRDSDKSDLEQRHGMIRVWKIWDLRTGVKHVLAEGHNKFLVENKPSKFCPLAVLKFHERPGQFYPMPVVWNWLSPQDEINETREQQKVHRRRYNRKYTKREGTITDTEIEKLESGEDGVYATHTGNPGEQPLMPVPDAPLTDSGMYLATAMQDFGLVSGITGEARGVPQSTTATQASIMEGHGQLRQGSARTVVGDWLGEIGRLILMTLREDMALPFWVKQAVDPTGPNAVEETARVVDLWQKIQAEDLGDIDMDVSVDLASLSPVTEEQQRTNWNQVLVMLTNPGIVMVLSQSERMLRKTLALYGIRTENEIREIQGVLKNVAAQIQAAAQAAAGGPGVAPMAGSGGGPGGGGMPMLPAMGGGGLQAPPGLPSGM